MSIRHYVPLSGSPDWAAGVVANRKLMLGEQRRSMGNASFRNEGEVGKVWVDDDDESLLLCVNGGVYTKTTLNNEVLLGLCIKKLKKIDSKNSIKYPVLAEFAANMVRGLSNEIYVLQYSNALNNGVGAVLDNYLFVLNTKTILDMKVNANNLIGYIESISQDFAAISNKIANNLPLAFLDNMEILFDVKKNFKYSGLCSCICPSVEIKTQTINRYNPSYESSGLQWLPVNNVPDTITTNDIIYSISEVYPYNGRQSNSLGYSSVSYDANYYTCYIDADEVPGINHYITPFVSHTAFNHFVATYEPINVSNVLSVGGVYVSVIPEKNFYSDPIVITSSDYTETFIYLTYQGEITSSSVPYISKSIATYSNPAAMYLDATHIKITRSDDVVDGTAMLVCLSEDYRIEKGLDNNVIVFTGMVDGEASYSYVDRDKFSYCDYDDMLVEVQNKWDEIKHSHSIKAPVWTIARALVENNIMILVK